VKDHQVNRDSYIVQYRWWLPFLIYRPRKRCFLALWGFEIFRVSDTGKVAVYAQWKDRTFWIRKQW
jgi:hypothetical protein